MRKILPGIAAILAVLNLIWLFAFDYKIPSFFIHSDMNAVSESENAETASTDYEDETSPADGEEEAEENTEQEAANDELAEADDLTEQTEVEPVGTCHPGEGNTPNIRSGPGSNYEVVGMAENNEVMIVTGEERDGWLPIRTMDGVEGYVFAGLVIIDGRGE